MSCVFCRIANGELPSKTLYEDDRIMVIEDISPVAPVHALVFPREHILEKASETNESNADIIAHIFIKIAAIANEHGWDYYRVVTNSGENAGQTVPHLHFHVLSGRKLRSMG